MNRKDRSPVLHRVLAKLEEAQTLSREVSPSPDTRVQMELLLEDVIVDLRKVLDLSVWPEPTSEQPPMEMLEEWLWSDGGCEATDQCWVEVDGTCPHGHPSCAPRSVPTQSSREEPKNGVS